MRWWGGTPESCFNAAGEVGGAAAAGKAGVGREAEDQPPLTASSMTFSCVTLHNLETSQQLGDSGWRR